MSVKSTLLDKLITRVDTTDGKNKDFILKLKRVNTMTEDARV
jgi:hypothetical protein